MPNAQVITVNDGSANVAFSPDSVGSSHVQLQNLAAATLNVREMLHFDRPANESATRRRQLRLNIPVGVVQSDGSTKIEMITFTGAMVSPVTVSSADRARVRTLAANALQDTSVVALFDNPEWIW